MAHTAYSDKLKHPNWQRKRLEVLNRDNFTCRMCGDTETCLNVHHTMYQGEPWQADVATLRTVCEDCHKVLHEAKQYNVLKVVKRLSPCGSYQIFYAFTDKEVLVLHLMIGSLLSLHYAIDYQTIAFINDIKIAS